MIPMIATSPPATWRWSGFACRSVHRAFPDHCRATGGDRDRPGPRSPLPSYLIRALAAVAAIGVVLVGAAPMALAATRPNADAIVTEATNGSPNVVDLPAAPFTLVDQGGRQVSLESLAGHTVCSPSSIRCAPRTARSSPRSSGWPIQMLGDQASTVDLVAVVANPVYNSTAVTNALTDRRDSIGWQTGASSLVRPPTREGVERLCVQVDVAPAGNVDHSDIVYIIDRMARPAKSSTPTREMAARPAKSSFSTLLAGQVQRFAQS